jgi:ATP-dependent protease HslVU (ClpYQ) peptidase subunit
VTCVVGLVDAGRVWIGADSASSWENDTARIQVARNAKVFRVGPLLVGSCGSGRVQNVFRGLAVPKRPRGLTAFDYIARIVAETTRRAMVDAGTVTREHEGAPDMLPDGSCFLIGYRGSLYRLDDDFSVDEPQDEVDAVGSGGPWALPVLELTAGKPPKERILAALKKSARHCWSVRAPFRVEVL